MTHQVDGLSVIRQQLQEQGVSAVAMNVIIASRRLGTEQQYRPHINRWLQFVVDGTSIPLSPVTDVLNFLSKTFHRGVGYESVNMARGTLSALGIMIEGCTAGNH